MLSPDASTREENSLPLLLYDGLSFEDMAAIPRSFRNAYYVLYFLRQSAPGHAGFTSHPWRGGFSAMHFFREVSERVPRKASVEIEQFQYASPGFIRFTVDRPTADFLCQCVDRVDKAQYGIGQAYSNLGSYIYQNELNKLSPSDPSWTTNHNKKLKSLTRHLLEALEIPNPDDLINSAARPFEAAKIARSLVNRLRELSGYQHNGLIRLPTIPE